MIKETKMNSNKWKHVLFDAALEKRKGASVEWDWYELALSIDSPINVDNMNADTFERTHGLVTGVKILDI